MNLPLGDFLPRWPGSPWEGWFVIGICRRGSSVRWTKTHLFRSRRMGGFHPVSAVEGLTAEGELVGTVGFADRIVEAREPLVPGDLQSGDSGLALTVPGRWDLRGVESRFELGWRGGTQPLEVKLSVEGRDVVRWARYGPLLRYLGVQGPLEGMVGVGRAAARVAGLGVVEHASGARVPFNPARAVPGRWHWDVLSFERDETSGADLSGVGLASLTLRTKSLGAYELGCGGRLPVETEGKLSARVVEYLGVASLGDGRSYPLQWRGRASAGAAELTYEARISTPLSACTPGGGFVGFDFEATLNAPGAEPRRYTGSGFCECGGPRHASSWKG